MRHALLRITSIENSDYPTLALVRAVRYRIYSHSRHCRMQKVTLYVYYVDHNVWLVVMINQTAWRYSIWFASGFEQHRGSPFGVHENAASMFEMLCGISLWRNGNIIACHTIPEYWDCVDIVEIQPHDTHVHCELMLCLHMMQYIRQAKNQKIYCIITKIH